MEMIGDPVNVSIFPLPSTYANGITVICFGMGGKDVLISEKEES